MFRNNEKLILASGSPRRRRFLEELGLEFTVQVADIDEMCRPGESPVEHVERLSAGKAAAVGRDDPGAWVIGADTVVVLDGEILGKPAGPEEALAVLQRLSGRTHEVWTGFTISRDPRQVIRSVSTRVRFAEVGREVLAAYVATGEPLDKAGGYGIQGSGGMLVEGIEGSYSNVVGLPMAELVGELLALGVIRPG